MDYEKLYKEALERAKKLYEQGTITESLSYVFPELKESEDERIRKHLISLVKNWDKDGIVSKYTSDANDIKQILAWLEKQESVGEIVERCKNSWYNEGKIAGMAEGLTNDEKYQQGWHDAIEKQGEQKSIIEMKSPEESLGVSSKEYNEIINDCLYSDNDMIEPKDYSSIDPHFFNPADKVEPKFHEGDWVVVSNVVYHIDKISGVYLTLSTLDGTALVYHISVLDSEHTHLWSIEDAKSGDVLVASDESLFIFARAKDNAAYYHYSLCKNGSQEISDGKHAWEVAKDCHPATKEQRELLFQKMKEAGYEWDAEKKELKKVSQRMISAEAKEALYDKPTWSEEDENILNAITYTVKNSGYKHCIGVSNEIMTDWLKSLKQRIKI